MNFENTGVGTLTGSPVLCEGIGELDIGFYNRQGLKKIVLGIFVLFDEGLLLVMFFKKKKKKKG